MNKPYSRFVPHSRSAYSARRAPMSAPAKQNRQRRVSYWFPIVTMMAAVLFAASAIMPRSIFGAFAAQDDGYKIVINSEAGEYTVTVTGGDQTDTMLSANEVEKISNDNGTVTFNVTLSEGTQFEITSDQPMSSIVFGEGAGAVTDLSLYSSGASSLDISKCTGLSSLDLSDVPSLSQHAYDIPYPAGENDFEVSLCPPGFTYVEDDGGYQFDVVGAGDMADQTVTLYENIEVKPDSAGEHYFIPVDDLEASFQAVDDNATYIYIVNSKKPGVKFYILARDAYYPEVTDPANSTTDPTDPADPTDPTDPTTDPTDPDTDSPNVALTVEKNSKNIIKNAYIENVESIDAKNLQIVAKTLSAADKKTFLAAVKKEDKDFDDSDSNLRVYNLYVADAKGNKVSVKGKAAVTATLAYPSNAVSFMYDEYDFTVYHQLDDKSIDTSINAYGTKDGIQFTTDSFSNFAISCSKDESGYEDITIAGDSKNIIKSAKAHPNTTFTHEETVYDVSAVKIIAKALSAADKKTFLDAIKKKDSKFKSDDKNLIVYDVKIVDDDGNELTIKGKVDFTFAYPNDTLSKNYSKYDFTVYHKVGDNIDTTPVAVSGKDGVTVTTDSFSAFAVAPTAKPSASDVPATGESNVPANVAMLLCLLSLVSFAGVYAKNKAAQY